jgi:hemerythrin-like domain-containing protein
MDVVEKVRSTLGTYAETDVRALLQADHEKIKELADALADAKSGPQRRSLLAQLKPLVTAHARAEEQAVYVPLTRLRDSPDSRLMGSEGAVEHFLVDMVLEKLDAARDATSDMWRAHATVLKELLEHHVKEEESEMFEELGEHFSVEQREAMGGEFARLRDERLAAETSPQRVPRAGNGARRDVGRVRRAQAA